MRRSGRYVTPFDRSQDATGFLTRGRLNIDARTETAYGTLRAFFRYELTALRGSYADIPFFGGQTNTSVLDKTFIQFAGIKAGRVQSFYDFYANELNFGTIAGSDTSPVSLAYTATFNAGFSATLGIEDRAERQVVGISPLDPFGTIFVPGGERMPNVIADLRYDNTAFGAAQLSGAVAQLNSVNRDVFGGFTNTDYGFAIQAAVQLNLPMLAPGDQFWLQAAYADGALSYLGVGNSSVLGGITLGQSDAVMPNRDPRGKRAPVAMRLQRLREAMCGQPSQSLFAHRYGFASMQSWNNLERGYSLTPTVAIRLCEMIPGLSLDWLYLGPIDGLRLDLAGRLKVNPTRCGQKTEF